MDATVLVSVPFEALGPVPVAVQLSATLVALLTWKELLPALGLVLPADVEPVLPVWLLEFPALTACPEICTCFPTCELRSLVLPVRT